MKKVVLLILILIGLGQSSVFAAATIQSYGGVVEDGSKLTITGLNFGTRADNGGAQGYLCRLWDDFEDGNFNGWNFVVDGSSWKISETYSRPGSTFSAHKTNAGTLDRMYISPDSKSSYYVSFWMYLASDMNVLNNNKYFRMGSTASKTNLVMNSNSNNGSVQETIEFANPSTVVSRGTQAISGLKGSWHLIEIETALPVQGSNKNFSKIWIDGKLSNELNGNWWPEEMNNSQYIAFGVWFSTTYGISGGWYYDDIYIDYTPARVVLGNASTFDSSNHRELQIPTSWGSSAIEFSVNTGSFQPGEKAYIYVIDANGNPSNGLPITIGGSGVADPVTPTLEPAQNLRDVPVQ